MCILIPYIPFWKRVFYVYIHKKNTHTLQYSRIHNKNNRGIRIHVFCILIPVNMNVYCDPLHIRIHIHQNTSEYTSPVYLSENVFGVSEYTSTCICDVNMGIRIHECGVVTWTRILIIHVVHVTTPHSGIRIHVHVTTPHSYSVCVSLSTLLQCTYILILYSTVL